jgi:hypothetical protein
MRRQFKREEETQLYTLVRELDYRVKDADELGTLVGYSAANSLARFESNTGSAEERQFQQVKAVHAGLEQAIRDAASKDHFTLICELQISTDPTLISLIKRPAEYAGPSELLAMMIKRISLNSRDYRDKIRRQGSALCEEARKKGIIYGTRNILITDYRTMEHAFK